MRPNGHRLSSVLLGALDTSDVIARRSDLSTADWTARERLNVIDVPAL
jgi:hypothetical protein